MIKFSLGDKVAFHRDVVRRLGHDKNTADARGSAAELKARLGQGDLATKLGAEVILNLLPFADASAIYRAGSLT